jgi:mannosyltransferase
VRWQDPVAQPANARAPAAPTPWSSLTARYELLGRIDLAIVGLTILAFGVAALHLGAKSLWLDEAESARFTSSLTELRHTVTGGDPNMGLYHVLLYLWQQVFGSGEIALRSLSVLFGGLSVPVIVLLGTRLFGRPAGLLSGLLLALSPFFVHYEQTARAYPLLVLLVLLSSYFFVRQIEQPSRPALIAYVLASVLAIYAHYFAAFILLVQFLTLLAVKRRAALTKEWLVAAGAIGILCVPEAVFAHRKGTVSVGWIPVPSLNDLVDLPSDVAGSRLLLIALLILACYGLFCAIEDRRSWPAGFVAAWILVPVLLVFAVSNLGRPLFVSYYMIIVLPALLLLAAAGLVRLPGRAVGIGVLGLLIVASALGISDWYTRPGQENYRGATRYVLEHQRPGDKIIYDPFFISSPFSYYEARAGESGPDEVESGTRPPRIWVAVRYGDPSEEIKQSLAGTYTPVASTSSSFPNPVVTLYQARSTAPPTGNAGRPKGVTGAAAALSQPTPQPSDFPLGWQLAGEPQGGTLAQHLFACLHLLAPHQRSSSIGVTGPGQLKIGFDVLGWPAATNARSAAASLAQGSSEARRCVASAPHFATTDFSLRGSGDPGVAVNPESLDSIPPAKSSGPLRVPAAAKKATAVYGLSYRGPGGAARGALAATTRGSATAVVLAYRTGEQPLPPKLLPALVAAAYQRLGEPTIAVP